jgi:tetratricopeptide (TPR) repeat protein
LNFYGIALFELKKYSEAAASFDQAIRVCDQNRSAREEPFYYSGLSYWRIGDRDRSLAKLHEVIELFPASEYAGKARNIIEIINRTRQ